MDVVLLVTKTCAHCLTVEQQLNSMGIPYCVRYCEDNPEILKECELKQSPILMVDGEVAFHGLPKRSELERFFSEKQSVETV